MEDFRKYLLIPLALTVASWAVADYLKLPLEPRIALVVSLALVAILAGLPFRKPLQQVSQQKPMSGWRRRSTWLSVGIISCSLVAFFAGLIGYRQALRATQSTNKEPKPDAGNSDPLGNPGKSNPPPGTKPDKTDVKVSSEVDLFLSKYVNNSIKRTPGKPRWAFAAADQTRSTVPEFDSAIASALADAGLGTVDLLRPTLITDDKLAELYDPDPILMRRLGEFCDGVIVAIADAHPVRNTGISDLNTVEVSMRVRVIPFTNGSASKAFSILERGAGFTTDEAERNARQRTGKDLKEQLSVALR